MTEWSSSLPSNSEIPSLFKTWLTRSPQLSTVFKKLCQHLSLQKLQQAWQACFNDEASTLALNSAYDCLVREIFLLGDNTAWSFGRVVIPRQTYNHWPNEFDNLDNQPIGESLLYNNPVVTRSAFSYLMLTARDPLFHNVTQPLNLIVDSLWARRSIFHIAPNKPLLITDVLLPNIPPYPA